MEYQPFYFENINHFIFGISLYFRNINHFIFGIPNHCIFVFYDITTTAPKHPTDRDKKKESSSSSTATKE